VTHANEFKRRSSLLLHLTTEVLRMTIPPLFPGTGDRSSEMTFDSDAANHCNATRKYTWTTTAFIRTRHSTSSKHLYKTLTGGHDMYCNILNRWQFTA